MLRAAITLDVDSLRLYADIHGLKYDTPGDDPIYTTALPRFAKLLEEARVPATVFAVGEDAARRPEAFTFLRATGSELASHSFRHDYRMSQRTSAEIDADLARAEEALHPLCPPSADGSPRRVRGFRAPGYNVSTALLSALVERGYLYDSSLLPAPSYWTARAAAIARYRLSGRPSASLRGRLSAFMGPVGPYRMDPSAPHRPRAGGALAEFPMAVSPRARLPVIGTSLILFPSIVRKRLVRQVLERLPLFNFEMHALDLLGPTDSGVPADIVRAQPDLRVSIEKKLAVFSELFSTLARSAKVRPLVEWVGIV